MSNMSIQAKFFQLVKERIDPHLSFVDELAELLELSNDSAYRRIRGETSLTFEELAKLSRHFGVSLDALMDSDSNELIFHFQPLNEEDFNFFHYLQYIESNVRTIAEAKDKEVIYIANEIPLFHLMHVPEVAAFKLFFWQKTILDFSGFRNEKFKLNKIITKVNDLSRSLRDLYCEIPSTEIYHSETIDTTLKQIEYYFEAGYFEDKSESIILLDRVSELVAHIKLQAEMGYKFKKSQHGIVPEHLSYEKENNFTVYHNDVLHTDNTILVRLEDRYLTFLTSNGISTLSTQNERFYKKSYAAINVLKRRATLISGTSEKERNRVFDNYFTKIDKMKGRLKAML